ncbi:hypothetical protein F5Y18DRAFT_427540 [Xylariaceae sp. FL1019]|nr:hypothetical protein F5Y18DRAFT_427540 [Xylariaceae sp. FL1019]
MEYKTTNLGMLYSLPPEIRQMVYAHCHGEGKEYEIHVHDIGYVEFYWIMPRRYPFTLPAIVYACRATYHENRGNYMQLAFLTQTDYRFGATFSGHKKWKVGFAHKKLDSFVMVLNAGRMTASPQFREGLNNIYLCMAKENSLCDSLQFPSAHTIRSTMVKARLDREEKKMQLPMLRKLPEINIVYSRRGGFRVHFDTMAKSKTYRKDSAKKERRHDARDRAREDEAQRSLEAEERKKLEQELEQTDGHDETSPQED